MAVKVIPQGDGKFCLRIGLFNTFLGWQTAEAAKLDVPTRKGSRTIVRCLDNLPHSDATRLATALAKWLRSQAQGKQRKNTELEAVAERYREVMGK